MQTIFSTAKAVVTGPTEFFRAMPKEGGYKAPLTFAIVMGVCAGLLQAVIFTLGLRPTAGLAMAAAAVIMTPIMVAVFSFIGAGLAWISWKALGSKESYETAYRCSAYASAITPVTALAGALPFIGPSIGMVWMTFVIIVASVEVHQIPKRRAQVVFGGLCAFFVLVSIAGQIAARAMRGRVEEALAGNAGAVQELAKQMAGAQKDMTPEQQAAMNAVMAQLQQAASNAQQQPAPAPSQGQ